ncbi:MAG: ParB/RepB/Spo0J family partition protein [Pseudomonadota bacterium]|nr:ParB/RepB/Spo0J family partition protein [Pseudomonadota bacterium]
MTETAKQNKSEDKYFLDFTLDNINDFEQFSLGASGLHSEFDQVSMLDINFIVSNPNQPRKHFNQESIRALADSIREYGLIQPILVREVGNKYEIIAGERRYLAAKEADLFQIPSIIKNMNDAEAFKISLLENLLREDLDPFEEANGYKQLQDMYGMTQEDIARIVKKSKATISEIMSLNKLPRPVHEKVRSTELTRTHLIEIARAESEEDMMNLVELALKKQLSVKDLRAAKQQLDKKGRGDTKISPVYVTLYKQSTSYGNSLSRLSTIEPDDIPEDDRSKLITKLENLIDKTREVVKKLRNDQ